MHIAASALEHCKQQHRAFKLSPAIPSSMIDFRLLLMHNPGYGTIEFRRNRDSANVNYRAHSQLEPQLASRTLQPAHDMSFSPLHMRKRRSPCGRLAQSKPHRPSCIAARCVLGELFDEKLLAAINTMQLARQPSMLWAAVIRTARKHTNRSTTQRIDRSAPLHWQSVYRAPRLCASHKSRTEWPAQSRTHACAGPLCTRHVIVR